MRKKEKTQTTPTIETEIVEINNGNMVGLNQFSENLKKCEIKVNVDKNDFDVHTVVLLCNDDNPVKYMDLNTTKMTMEFDKCEEMHFNKVLLVIDVRKKTETTVSPFISFIDSEYVPHEMCRHTIPMEENSETTVLEFNFKDNEWCLHVVKKAELVK